MMTEKTYRFLNPVGIQEPVQLSPLAPRLINWPEYNAVSDKYLYIVEPLQVKFGFSRLV
jgi:hypothetical protein